MSSRDRDDATSIPEITVEFSHSIATFDAVDNASTYAPSSANNSSLLSPRNGNFPRDGRASPAVESTDGSCPPSPTISDFSSSNFPTSTLLRYNQPDELHSNQGSLLSHESTVADFHDPGIQSRTSDATYVNNFGRHLMPSSSTDPQGMPSEKGDPRLAAPGPVTAAVSGEPVDTAPFLFDPNLLAQMLDPKNIEALTQMGGTSGLLQGLGTDPFHGLTTQPSGRGAGVGASHRHDTSAVPDGSPQLSRLDPSQIRTTSDGPNNPVYHATLVDRRRVYGENVLPDRPSKSLLYLMWSALTDKVLVSFSRFHGV